MMRAFWRGVASLFDFTGSLARYDIADDPVQADYDALRSDWDAVGGDMRRAMTILEVRRALSNDELQAQLDAIRRRYEDGMEKIRQRQEEIWHRWPQIERKER